MPLFPDCMTDRRQDFPVPKPTPAQVVSYRQWFHQGPSEQSFPVAGTIAIFSRSVSSRFIVTKVFIHASRAILDVYCQSAFGSPVPGGPVYAKTSRGTDARRGRPIDRAHSFRPEMARCGCDRYESSHHYAASARRRRHNADPRYFCATAADGPGDASRIFHDRAEADGVEASGQARASGRQAHGELSRGRVPWRISTGLVNRRSVEEVSPERRLSSSLPKRKLPFPVQDWPRLMGAASLI